MTHAGQKLEIKYAELFNIQKDQIRHTAYWNTNAIHKGYLTTLPQEFIQNIADFDPKHMEIYHIVRSAVITFSVLFCAFWGTLNPALEIFLKDIATK